MIRAGVGLSTDPDSVAAAAEAASEAMASLGEERADWCLAFATVDHAEALSDALRTFHEVTGTPYVAGCSGAGVVANGVEVEEGPALGVLAVASDSIRATPFMFEDEGDAGLAVGARVGERLVSSRGTGDLVIVWPDPFQVRPDNLLNGIESVLGAVPVVGGAAAGWGGQQATFQFCGSDSAGGAVSGIRLGGQFRHRVVVTQGCRPLGEPMPVTAAHDNLLLEVAGRPPLEVLRELAPEHLFEPTAKTFDYLFVALLPDPDPRRVCAGEYLVRNIVAADEDAGVLGIVGDVEEGEHILFVEREAGAARDDMARVLSQARDLGLHQEFQLALYFNCLARGRSFHKRADVDAGMIRKTFPNLPLLGFFCNAEIAPLGGVNHVLTYTGVLVLVGE